MIETCTIRKRNAAKKQHKWGSYFQARSNKTLDLFTVEKAKSKIDLWQCASFKWDITYIMGGRNLRSKKIL